MEVMNDILGGIGEKKDGGFSYNLVLGFVRRN
jgi:hypothetical protein